jgi:inner membrane protease subunit 1
MWLQGDNLNVSRDSRDYGPVPLGLVKGRAVLQVGRAC